MHLVEPKPHLSTAPIVGLERPSVRGKFLYAGDEKFFVRGVTYGTFRPNAHGGEYDRGTVERDFAEMAKHHINTVRVYTVPPRWLLHTASRYGLRVMVGLPWEQHVAFLDDQNRIRSIEERVRTAARVCAGHPAILCYAIGNEIPASIVRWHGARRVEHFLKRLYQIVKAEDPGALVTYVNYPSTEYLRLDFVDLVSFNVYLESQDALERYLARLHNLAGNRPLLLAEVGLDSCRHGEAAQAASLDSQVRTAFTTGCGGAFVFAWTDEWYRGGGDIDDWAFGLTTRDRRPKPALTAASQTFAESPFPPGMDWPRVSVIVCSYNGGRTLGDCLEALCQIDYPDFEVIVVDDGSTDATPAVASEYDVRLIRTENRGLSSARNTGLMAATGEIVAYTDDDAYPDPHWLTYLAAMFQRTNHVGIGGPNIPPRGDGPIADCVANAPGGPVHVLLDDELAEHIPGCNMAFRRERLIEIGGFDPRYRVAGDDVDICWRLQERGWTIAFSPAAIVWHHRRNSIRGYWKQQQGYGKAETLLEQKWPERFNAVGHLCWAGRLYGKGLTEALGSRKGRIYGGTWGTAPFQSLYQPAPGIMASLPLLPEWYLVVAALAAVSALGLLWAPLFLALPLLAFGITVPLLQAGLSAADASFPDPSTTRRTRLKLWGLTTFLHLLQPLARLRGRLCFGSLPWRRRSWHRRVLPRPLSMSVWTERWQAVEDRLEAIEDRLKQNGAMVLRGGGYDRWDLTVRGGLLGNARIRMAVEEHGGGKQLARFRIWPACSPMGLYLTLPLAVLALAAALEGAGGAALPLGVVALTLAIRTLAECSVATASVLSAVARLEGREWTTPAT